jgi:hypothetical protein
MQTSRILNSATLAIVAFLLVSGPALCTDPMSHAKPIDLVNIFHTRSAWRLVVTQGPPTTDYGDEPAPGALHICLQKAASAPCAPDSLPMPPPADGKSYNGWEPHYLNVARPVYLQGRSMPPLLLIVTASMYAGDGGRLVATQLFKYDRDTDSFARIYAHSTGTNNDEEVRFISSGPLSGDVISAEPSGNAPYAFWIEVNTFTPVRTYSRVLRYRSATRYGDGNPLGVIDSEMPNIERRLGLWKPGMPLPTPTNTACVKPYLKRGELWCR